MIRFGPATVDAAEEAFDAGMEFWWAGERRTAIKHFRRAIKLDPLHADALNHLGIVNLECKKLHLAKQYFEAAMLGGERHLERDGDEIPWGILANRPYLRAMANLALVYLEQRQWALALALHQQLLKLNPNDNLGARFLIGPEYLQLGDDESAIKALESCAHEEVGCAFGLALAKLRAGRPPIEVGEALLAGFAANRYVAPMLLGASWERLDAFFGTTMAEPEWAQDVIDAQYDLWHATPRGIDVLRFWWMAAQVVAWRSMLDDITVRLKTLPVSNERSQLVNKYVAARSSETIGALVRTVRTAS